MVIIQDRMLILSLQMKVSCSSWRASSEAPGRTSADINEFHQELSFKSPRAMLDALLPADMANVSMGPVREGWHRVLPLSMPPAGWIWTGKWGQMLGRDDPVFHACFQLPREEWLKYTGPCSNVCVWMRGELLENVWPHRPDRVNVRREGAMHCLHALH